MLSSDAKDSIGPTLCVTSKLCPASGINERGNGDSWRKVGTKFEINIVAILYAFQTWNSQKFKSIKLLNLLRRRNTNRRNNHCEGMDDMNIYSA